MNNYFGIGLDAKISLEFNNKRDEHPKKCRLVETPPRFPREKYVPRWLSDARTRRDCQGWLGAAVPGWGPLPAAGFLLHLVLR